MSIVKMKKLSLFASGDQKDKLLRDLLLLGCVEVSEPVKLMEEPGIADIARRGVGEAEKYTEARGRILNALSILDKYAPVKSKIFGSGTRVSEDDLLDESRSERRLQLADEIIASENEIRHKDAEKARLLGDIEQLKPWRGLMLPLDKTETGKTAVYIGSLSGSVNIYDVEDTLEVEAPCSELFTVYSDKSQRCVCLVALKDQAETALEVVRGFGFAQSSLRGNGGTAEENISALERRIAELEAEKQDVIRRITEAAVDREELKLEADLASTKIARAEVTDRLVCTETTVYLTGWIPAVNTKRLEGLLKNYLCAYELEDPTDEEAPEVPTSLKNNFLTRPLMMVTRMYSMPSYDGVDPNPLILPWFCLFFGIMYADMGYGAILLLLGIFGSIFIRKKGGIRYALGLLILCGITTTLCGFLFGSFFGDAVPVITDLLGLDHKELWSFIDPIKEPMTALIGSLAIGCVHLVVGMGINAVMLIRDGKWKDALFDVGSWWLLFAGIAVGAMGITWWVLIAGVAALVLTQGRSKPTFIGKIIGGVASLYDITSYLGDVLSYSRLMALMLAGSVIASVVNMLGSLTGSIVAFAIIFVIGHLFNMGINIIGTYVHAARLQYLEFFGKFYRDGGREFDPLRINTKFVDVVKEEN